MIAEHEGALKRTARRYSLDAEDADDAYQRALEIVLTKAPTTDPRELIRWTQTVTKHEALALRQSRERLLGHGGDRPPADAAPDPVALIPAAGDGPDEQVERREAIARSREALRALKPAELRALSLLAEGYSYAEIGELTGFSQTKINRVLAEGRDRFRSLLSSSEDGSRCRELRPLLSAFCDGEASSARRGDGARAPARLRPLPLDHARLPGGAADRGRAGAGAASLALAARARARPARRPGLAAAGVGGGGDSALPRSPSAGGSRGAGMAALAKLLALCAGAAAARPPAWRRACCRRPPDPATHARARDRSNARSAGPRRNRRAKRSNTNRRRRRPAARSQSRPSHRKEPKPEPPSQSERRAGAVEYEAPPPARAANRAASGGESSGRAARQPGSSDRDGPHQAVQRFVAPSGRCALHLAIAMLAVAHAGGPCGERELAAARPQRRRRRGELARRSARFALRWSNPPGPVAAVHYRVLDPPGRSRSARRRSTGRRRRSSI